MMQLKLNRTSPIEDGEIDTDVVEIIQSLTKGQNVGYLNVDGYGLGAATPKPAVKKPYSRSKAVMEKAAAKARARVDKKAQWAKELFNSVMGQPKPHESQMNATLTKLNMAFNNATPDQKAQMARQVIDTGLWDHFASKDRVTYPMEQLHDNIYHTLSAAEKVAFVSTKSWLILLPRNSSVVIIH